MFLSINGLFFGKTYNYTAEKQVFEKVLRTASKRLTSEKIAEKWKVSVTYSYLSNADRTALLAQLRTSPLEVTFYEPETGEQTTISAKCTKLPVPKIAKFEGAVPSVWTDISFVLEEI